MKDVHVYTQARLAGHISGSFQMIKKISLQVDYLWIFELIIFHFAVSVHICMQGTNWISCLHNITSCTPHILRWLTMIGFHSWMCMTQFLKLANVWQKVCKWILVERKLDLLVSQDHAHGAGTIAFLTEQMKEHFQQHSLFHNLTMASYAHIM